MERPAPGLGECLIHLDDDILVKDGLKEVLHLSKLLVQKIYSLSPLTEIAFLLEAGANANLILSTATEDKFKGFGALHIACIKERPDRIELFQLLLHYKADVNIPTQNLKSSSFIHSTMTALHLIMEYNPSLAEIDLLLNSGAKITLAQDNLSPLHCAAEYAVSVEIIERLTRQSDANWQIQISAEACRFGGYTPLHLAILNYTKYTGSTLTTFAAIAKYSDINAVNARRRTPLHLACHLCIPLVLINILLNQKPNLSLKNDESLSALEAARRDLSKIRAGDYNDNPEEVLNSWKKNLTAAIEAIQQATPISRKTLTRKLREFKNKPTTNTWSSIQQSLEKVEVVSSSNLPETVPLQNPKDLVTSLLAEKKALPTPIRHLSSQPTFQDPTLLSIYQDFHRRLHEANRSSTDGEQDIEEARENLHAGIHEYIKISTEFDNAEIIKLICKTELGKETRSDIGKQAQQILQKIISENTTQVYSARIL